MVVDPSHQNLFGTQSSQVVERLSRQHQSIQAGHVVQIDLIKETDLKIRKKKSIIEYNRLP